MKAINLKFLSTSVLLFSIISSHGTFAVAPIRPDNPIPGTLGTSSSMMSSSNIEFVTPVTTDILGNNLAVSFNSPIGTATVTIEDQYGNPIYQSVVNTNTQSVLYVPIENWEAGSYTITVISESTNFVSGFQL